MQNKESKSSKNSIDNRTRYLCVKTAIIILSFTIGVTYNIFYLSGFQNGYHVTTLSEYTVFLIMICGLFVCFWGNAVIDILDKRGDRIFIIVALCWNGVCAYLFILCVHSIFLYTKGNFNWYSLAIYNQFNLAIMGLIISQMAGQGAYKIIYMIVSKLWRYYKEKDKDSLLFVGALIFGAVVLVTLTYIFFKYFQYNYLNISRYDPTKYMD